ncbi:MAG: ATP synthase F1 subunit gamma, partial [Acidobacteriota bacterium]
MANRRVLVKRRKSVRNIRKITRTMQLIATARFQAAFNRAVATRPYTEKLAELVADLSNAGVALEHPLLEPANPAAPVAYLVLTSNRGLCGGYNANILRVANEALTTRRAANEPTGLQVYGKKGIAFFKYRQRTMDLQSTSVSEAPKFEDIEPIANQLMADFLSGKISGVRVVYMRFLSAGQQRPQIVQLLPLVQGAAEKAASAAASAATAKARSVEYEFLPDPLALLDELLPATVRIRLFQAFMDAAVSEQIARMVAMKAATEAAEDMIKELTRDYNRARQTHITMELLDIVGGANALA